MNLFRAQFPTYAQHLSQASWTPSNLGTGKAQISFRNSLLFPSSLETSSEGQYCSLVWHLSAQSVFQIISHLNFSQQDNLALLNLLLKCANKGVDIYLTAAKTRASEPVTTHACSSLETAHSPAAGTAK